MFTEVCVGIVITVLVGLATLGVSAFATNDGDNEETMGCAWIFASIGFGVSLTILLYQNGVI
jgi:hypothetical protein